MNNFWVINTSNLKYSKNINENQIPSFLDIMEREHICLFGYFDSSGQTFKNKIELGDIIIVSQRGIREAYKRDPEHNYFSGIVNSDAYLCRYYDNDFQARKIKKFISLKGKKLTFKEDSISYPTVQPIYKLKTSNDKDKILIDEIKKIMDINMIKECKELLEQNYNLILTGAPGTGKTYLAKEIAKEMMKDNTTQIKDYKQFIIDYYNKNKDRLEKLKKEGDELREQFRKKFPIESLKNISIDDYAVGRGDKNSFCYWIEYGLKRELLDNFSALGSKSSYILYYDKKTGNLVNETDKTDDELIKEIGEELYKMATIENYDDKDSVFNKRKNYLSIKIYNTYHPYTYFPMMSNEDILSICDIFSIEKDNNIYKLNKNIKSFFDNNLKDIDSYIIKIILSENIKLLEGNTENINSKELDYGFVQFHPSYDYTDFVEGLRPIKDSDGKIGFERKDGVFKEFCKKALKNLIDSKKEVSELNKDTIIKNNLIRFIDDVSNIINEKGYFKIDGIDRKAAPLKEINLYDTDMSFDIDTKSAHKIKKNLDDMVRLYKIFISKSISEWNRSMLISAFGFESFITYVYGFLKAFYEKYNSKIEEEVKNNTNTVEKVQKKNFVFIIDEINRGEISKIFGELFFAVDPGYRGIKGKVLTQYSNLIDEESEKYFYIPENVYIIGTMNDIDRSVESMDFAMRRRFAWKEVNAKETQENILKSLDSNIKQNAIDRMNALNNAISEIESFNSSYHIGASYFLKLENYYKSSSDNKNKAFDMLWENHLRGLLYEYLRGMPDAENKLDELKKSYNSGCDNNTQSDSNTSQDSNN
ncbi:ATPase associated with various cellular activities AAA_5 [Brachyspira intermedia PWS/A]|uniref:ATPase associated with various cellular activities AAA_5 n=1 Tax=Brachyspira intermedia (strain ATCC 51140 / PWS/A) TaxID=1045858 RepID=G0EQ32_BRAIP|nr:AAA family ATPase [Brachyspira intermedia]AEM23290.1 ATPase associated with various cellular activities AAA_5 [Brachyspira intermedia PWS/A]